MDQLYQAPDTALADLKRRAVGQCIVFHDQQLPPGANPARARIGIEVDTQGAASLLIGKGIAYHGDRPMVRQWLTEGCLQFESFERLCLWIRQELAPLYRAGEPDTYPHVPGLIRAWSNRDGEPPLVRRDALIQEIELNLARQARPIGLILVGPSGVGKTAVCREVARRWEAKQTANMAFGLNLPAVLAGAADISEQHQRLQQVFAGLLELVPRGLLIVENVALMCGPNPRGAGANVVGIARRRPMADRLLHRTIQEAVDAGLHILGTAAHGRLGISRDAACRRRFRLLRIPELTTRAVVDEILPAVAKHLAKRFHIEIAPECLSAAVREGSDTTVAQPAKAISVLEQAVVRAKSRGLVVVGPDDVVP